MHQRPAAAGAFESSRRIGIGNRDLGVDLQRRSTLGQCPFVVTEPVVRNAKIIRRHAPLWIRLFDQLVCLDLLVEITCHCGVVLGNDVETVWKKLLACESGVGPTTVFDASRFPSRITAEIKDFDVTQYGEDSYQWEHAGRHTRFAVGAAYEAMTSSGVMDAIDDPTRFGVYLGAGEGAQDFNLFMGLIAQARVDDEVDLEAFARLGMEQLHAESELEQEPNMTAGHLASLFNAQGPNMNCLTACAASSQAIGEATWYSRAPALPMGYATGWAMINAARDDVVAEMTDQSLRSFHDALLAHGSCALSLVLGRAFGEELRVRVESALTD